MWWALSAHWFVLLVKNIMNEINIYIYARFWNPTLQLTSTESPNLMIIPPPPNDMMLARIHRGFDYDVSTDTYRVSNILFTRYLGMCNS